MKDKVSIIGAGSWGTTLAIALSQKTITVNLHSVFRDHNLAMQRQRENRLFLKGVKFPSLLHISPSLRDTVQASQVIVIAIPVKYLLSILKRVKDGGVDLKGKIFVSVSKGIEARTLKRPSELIQGTLGASRVAVLSGPNIATEVLKKIPSTSILACNNKNTGKKLQQIFSSPAFRVYLHTDIAGVELGGALKNIIALSCGISDGLGFGTNTKAALVTRGLAEITRLGQKLGANASTFWGISGLGDLVTTCFSPYSRNRSVGEQIGKGKCLEDVTRGMEMVAEGLETVKSAYRLSKQLDVEMPITRQVYLVLYRGKPARKAVTDLMARPLKTEKVD
jgi:glycerol-3-phosphate dehydrogenase (NAD(P)+)